MVRVRERVYRLAVSTRIRWIVQILHVSNDAHHASHPCPMSFRNVPNQTQRPTRANQIASSRTEALARSVLTPNKPNNAISTTHTSNACTHITTTHNINSAPASTTATTTTKLTAPLCENDDDDNEVSTTNRRRCLPSCRLPGPALACARS